MFDLDHRLHDWCLITYACKRCGAMRADVEVGIRPGNCISATNITGITHRILLKRLDALSPPPDFNRPLM